MNTTAAIISHSNFFVRCWSGQAKLWQAFWLGAILGKVLVLVGIAALMSLLWRGPQDNALVNIFFGSVLLSYVVFASVSVWRCARNTKTGAFGGLARVWVVFSLGMWATAVARAL